MGRMLAGCSCLPITASSTNSVIKSALVSTFSLWHSYNSGADTLAVIRHFKLDRHRGVVQRHGELELKMIVEEALRNSEPGGQRTRENAIQTVVMTQLSFYTTCRASTLGPSHKQYEQDGKVRRFHVTFLSYLTHMEQYIRCGEVRIFRLGFMTFETLVRFKNFKVRVLPACKI